MADVFSDGRCTPAPTLAQLMTLSSAELLELTCPASRHAEPIRPCEPLVESSPTMIRACSQCGQDFEIPQSTRPRATCSKECHIAMTRNGAKVPCAHCGTIFATNQQGSKRMTCSDACYRKMAYKGISPDYCLLCNKLFTRPRFADGSRSKRRTCSLECQMAYRRIQVSSGMRKKHRRVAA